MFEPCPIKATKVVHWNSLEFTGIHWNSLESNQRSTRHPPAPVRHVAVHRPQRTPALAITIISAILATTLISAHSPRPHLDANDGVDGEEEQDEHADIGQLLHRAQQRQHDDTQLLDAVQRAQRAQHSDDTDRRHVADTG